MLRNKFILIVFFTFITYSSQMFAQEPKGNGVAFVDRIVSVPFEPVAAMMFLHQGNSIIAGTKGVIQESGKAAGQYIIAGELSSDIPTTGDDLKLGILLFGKNGETTYKLPIPTTVEFGKNGIELNDRLSRKISERNAIKASWILQVKAQDHALEELRGVADILGDLGRIVDIKQEIISANEKLADLEKDKAALSRFVSLAKSYPIPKNLLRRELELLSQLPELTKGGSINDTGEVKKRAQRQIELQKKLALIESTRGENIAKLRVELEQLRHK